MPKTIPLIADKKIEYQKTQAGDICRGLLWKNHVTQKQVAEVLGISPQAICKQFKSESLTLETVMAVIYLCHPDANEIEHIMKAR